MKNSADMFSLGAVFVIGVVLFLIYVGSLKRGAAIKVGSHVIEMLPGTKFATPIEPTRAPRRYPIWADYGRAVIQENPEKAKSQSLIPEAPPLRSRALPKSDSWGSV